MTIKIHGDKIEFPDGTEQTTANQGGGDSNPTPLVWEDVTADRLSDIRYTNTNDVPLYINISSYSRGNYSYCTLEIDDVLHARVGEGGTTTSTTEILLNNIDAVIPAGSSYKIIISNDTQLRHVREATMPMAIGAGGEGGTGDAYTKAESDATNEAQDAQILANTRATVTNFEATEANSDAIEQNTADIAAIGPHVDAYTKTETNTLLDSKANVGDSYLKTETYTNVETDAKLFTKADKETTYTKDEVDTAIENIDSIDEAPINGKEYVRKNAAWFESTSGGGGGLPGPPVKDPVPITEGETVRMVVYGEFLQKFEATYKYNTMGEEFPLYVDYSPGIGNCFLVDEHPNFATDYGIAQDMNVSSITSTGADVSNEWESVEDGDILQIIKPGYDPVEHVLSDVSWRITGDGTGETFYEIRLLPVEDNTGVYVEEAPNDGRQYTRQNRSWREVYGMPKLPPRTIIPVRHEESQQIVLYEGDDPDASFAGMALLYKTPQSYGVKPEPGEYYLGHEKQVALDFDKVDTMFVSGYNGTGQQIKITEGSNRQGQGGGGSGGDIWEFLYPGDTIALVGVYVSYEVVEVVKIGEGDDTYYAIPIIRKPQYEDGLDDGTGEGGTVPEAPKNGNKYGRKDGAWSQIDELWVEYAGGFASYDNDIRANGVIVGKGGSTVGPIESNTVVGQTALNSNSSGRLNTAIGNRALSYNLIGDNNTAVGYYALGNNRANNNTAIGRSAGLSLTEGSNNTLLGNEAEPSSPTVSNEVTIGNDSVTSTRLKGNVTAQSLSTVGTATIGSNLSTTGSVTIGTLASVGSGTHVVCNTDGTLLKTTAVYMTEEEVDKRLATKDKLIEKLTARLDKLEKRMK